MNMVSPLGTSKRNLENWWASRDLNPQPADYESDALTIELKALLLKTIKWRFTEKSSEKYLREIFAKITKRSCEKLT